jgi:hypothetical protein
MARGSSVSVEQFLDALSHPRKAEIQELRAAILGSSPAITEQVKWNAPSFCVNGDDRVTFRLQPGDRVELVFHRGATKRTDSDSFTFADPSGLVQWATALLRLVAAHQVDSARCVTHRFGLDEFLDAYDVFGRAAETGALKVALSRR